MKLNAYQTKMQFFTMQKAELEEAKAGKAKAEQEAAFFRERLALRDAFIEQGYGRAGND